MRKVLSLMLAVMLVCGIVMPATIVAAADADILYETSTTWFPINESTGANAKFFMLKDGTEYNLGADYTDYIYGLDYDGNLTYDASAGANIATGTSADVPADISKKIGAIIYTVDATDKTGEWDTNPGLNLTTKDGNKYWNILEKDYLVTPEEKVIKLYTSVDASKCEDTDLAARFNSLNQVTFDVTDGQYQNIGFLASASWGRNLTATLVYKDGTKSAAKVIALPGPSALKPEGIGQAYGYVCIAQAKTHSYNLYRVFRPYTMEADVTKTLDKITLKSSYRADPIFVISSWGEKPSIKAQLDEVINVEELTEENFVKAQEAINKFLEYVEACGLTYEDLDADMKAKVDTILNPYAQILANKLATLDENAEITAENIYTYKNALVEIEKYRAENELEYTQEQTEKIAKINANIEAVEYGVVAADVNKKIAELPSPETVTVDNFAEISLKVQEIKNIIAQSGIKAEDISAENTALLEAMNAKLAVVILDVTTIVPMDIQDGANAKLFLELGEEDNNYVDWKDYITGVWFSAVKADTSWTPRVIRYSTEEPDSSSSLHIYAPNNIFTMKGIPYKVGGQYKGIRLHGARKVETGDEKLAEIMGSYTTTTINLDYGMYNNLYLAATNFLGNAGAPNSEVKYVLSYKDGSKEEGSLSIFYNPDIPSYLPSDGYIPRTELDGTKSSSIKFDNYTIKADPNKQVASLKLSNSDTSRMIFILGISGETAKIGEVKEAIESKINYSIPAIGTSSKATLLELEGLINEYVSAGGDANDFEGIEKFKADIDEYYKGVIEFKASSNDVDFENTYFEAEYTKDIEINQNTVSVIKGDTPLAASEYSISVDGNKFKIVIPDDHKKSAEYTVRIGTGIKNKANENFYVEKEEEIKFVANKAIAINKFAIEEGTVNIEIANNMKAKNQEFVLVVAAYNEDNTLVGSREVKGTLKNSTPVTAALDVSSLGAGVKVECFLFDNIDTIKYLDSANAIVIAE